MRTEDDLRQALLTLADTAHDPATVAAKLRLDAPIGRPSTRTRWRPVVGIVAVCVALALVALFLPSLLSRRADVADLRRAGYWGFVATVDPSSGWQVIDRAIDGDHEIMRVSRDDARSGTCTATVYGRGAQRDETPAGTPVDVAGRPGAYVPSTDIDPARLVWSYEDDAWAATSCDDTVAAGPAGVRGLTTQLATSIRFQASPAQIPFGFRTLPDGYRVDTLIVTSGRGTQSPSIPGAQVFLSSPGRPSLSVYSTASAFSEPGPGMPGIEILAVDGRTVTVREDRRAAQIAVGDHYVMVESTVQQSTQSWLPGERAAILDLVDQLRFASNLADPATWFDAEQAIPD